MHDLQDHAAGGRAALGVGVDADGLLGGACVLLAVYVDPAEQKRRLRVAAIQSFNARLKQPGRKNLPMRMNDASIWGSDVLNH